MVGEHAAFLLWHFMGSPVLELAAAQIEVDFLLLTHLQILSGAPLLDDVKKEMACRSRGALVLRA